VPPTACPRRAKLCWWKPSPRPRTGGRARSCPPWHGLTPLGAGRRRAPLANASSVRGYAQPATAAVGPGPQAPAPCRPRHPRPSGRRPSQASVAPALAATAPPCRWLTPRAACADARRPDHGAPCATPACGGRSQRSADDAERPHLPLRAISWDAASAMPGPVAARHASSGAETADGLWSIDVDDVLLARLDARTFTRYPCKTVIAVAGLFCHRGFRLLHAAAHWAMKQNSPECFRRIIE
jgi:hypothetical protein